jgi:hypothetical protein
VEWNHLAEDRDCWWAVVSVVMNFKVLVPRSWLVRGESALKVVQQIYAFCDCVITPNERSM